MTWHWKVRVSFFAIYIYIGVYTFQRDTQCCRTDCLLTHRCQLYMFRTVTVHPQELLIRCCMCRLWYVVRTALSDTSHWYQRDVADSAVLTIYHSLHIQHLKEKLLRMDCYGPKHVELTYASINNQCCNIVYLVGMYMYCKKWYMDLPMSSCWCFYILNPDLASVCCWLKPYVTTTAFTSWSCSGH